MDWAPMSNASRAPPSMMAIPDLCGGGMAQENQARPKFHRTLSDITNTTGVGLGHQSGNKQPLLDPKTPARRTKSGETGFAVCDDFAEFAQSAPRRPASPPQVRPKSRNGDEEIL